MAFCWRCGGPLLLSPGPVSGAAQSCGPVGQGSQRPALPVCFVTWKCHPVSCFPAGRGQCLLAGVQTTARHVKTCPSLEGQSWTSGVSLLALLTSRQMPLAKSSRSFLGSRSPGCQRCLPPLSTGGAEGKLVSERSVFVNGTLASPPFPLPSPAASEVAVGG